MSRMTHEERRMNYFSSLKEGDVIQGTVIEYVGDHVALVEINTFLVRCIMKEKVKVGQTVSLRLDTLDRAKNLVVLKIV